ncbi:MAG TPA: MFS transporter [Candidatus Binatia bacterium]|nr:MFS transporter [Candidatus Binatia bacterium]
MAARPTPAAQASAPHDPTAATARAREDRLPLRIKLGYGIGELVVGIRMSSMNLVLFPFYTDVAQLTPALVGAAIALGKVWDGANDPIIGYLSDQTRTRWGRRRPYLLISALPLALSFAALWRPPLGVSQAALFWYLFGALFVLDVFFGFYSTPYLALGAEMSPSYDERTRVAAIRAVFHNVGLLLGGAILIGVARALGDGAVGHAGAGSIFGAVMAVAALVAFFGSREPGLAPREVAPSLRQFVGELRDSLRLRSFRLLLGSFAFLLAGSALNQSFALYVFRDAMGTEGRQAVMLLVYLAAATLSFPGWAAIATRLGKNRAFEVCLAWSIAALCASPIIGPALPFWVVLGFITLAGLGVGGYVLPVAIVADIFDEDELATGRRREGSYFGVWTLVMKLASAVGVALAGFVLPWIGYVPGAASQSPATITALKLVWGPGAAFFVLATLLVFRRFPLTRERHVEIQQQLAERHLARAER